MERDPNLVSVIIPCFNHGAYIQEALQSILDQSFQNFEVIVVNDGSDDPETIRVLKEIDLPRVTVYHKKNEHLSAARNFGIGKSKGAFILPLDSDDKFEPTFIEKAVAVLESRPEVGVVTSHVRYFGSNRRRPFLPEGGQLKDFLTQNNSCGNALYRYQCWVDAGGYNPKLRAFEDWDFWIGVTKKGWLVHTIPEFLFNYRDTPNSMSKSAHDKHPELVRRIVENHIEVYREHVADVLYQKELQILHLESRIKHLREAKKKTLRHKLRRALKWRRLSS